ncbi:MAG: 3'-5' exonuclease [Capnocytophaga sp.]|nr:3'-5' exonuclease [Capnocytophaga sp.]
MSFFDQLFGKASTATSIPIEDVVFVVFDTETTGFNYATDRILSIGAVRVQDNRIEIKDSFEIFLAQEVFNPESVPIHGIIKHHKYEKIPEKEAVSRFADYVKNTVLVGHHVGYDVKMVNAALERHGLPPLENKFIDTNYLFKKTKTINVLLQNDKNYSLDEVCHDLNITTHDRHNAAGDALLTSIAFLKIVTKLSQSKRLHTLGALLRL